jgi:2-keto-3-deoxy-L-rhamnonate aldolase RhmA
MKMRNFVKEKLAGDGYVLGAFVASGSPMNCECLGINGMDFIIIDAEHAQTNTETMVDMARASELYGMAAFVRVYDPYDYPMMSRLLDVGIHGLMVPMVESREQADRIIHSVKYPPLGMRGANGGRGPRWGMYEDYTKQSNDNLYTIMQCETRKGVENIEEICQTPGLDCVFIGTADLSQNMGHPGDVNNPEVVAAVGRVLAACQKYHVVPGIVTGTAEAAVNRLKQGFRLVTCMNDQVFFRTESAKRLKAVRDGFAG